MTPRLLPSAPITDPRQNLKAIELVVLATVCFAFLHATAKYLVTVEAIPVVQATLTSLHLPLAFSAAALWPFAFKPALHSAKRTMQVVCSAIIVGSTASNQSALPGC